MGVFRLSDVDNSGDRWEYSDVDVGLSEGWLYVVCWYSMYVTVSYNITKRSGLGVGLLELMFLFLFC